jgi:glycosyltransferase involved in cell wall biosynthesis
MVLAATIITGNSQDIVATAVRSVSEFVDMICVVDTGVTDQTRAVIQEAARLCKVVFNEYTWCNDFANARNRALTFGRECDADWTLMVDTDEEVSWRDGVDKNLLVEMLESDPLIDAWCAMDAKRSHLRERIIRCSHRLRWKGAVHEMLTKQSGTLRTGMCELFVVSEIPKTSAQINEKMVRDVEALTACHADDPGEARWVYYLGEAHEGLEDWDASIAWYDKCVSAGHAGYGPWAAYRCARVLFQAKQFERSYRMCNRGLEINPIMPELLWLAGLNCYQKQQYVFSANLARFAIQASQQLNSRFLGSLIAFRDIAAWNELPYNLLAWSCLQVGDEQGHLEAKELADRLAAQRGALVDAGNRIVECE